MSFKVSWLRQGMTPHYLLSLGVHLAATSALVLFADIGERPRAFPLRVRIEAEARENPTPTQLLPEEWREALSEVPAPSLPEKARAERPPEPAAPRREARRPPPPVRRENREGRKPPPRRAFRREKPKPEIPVGGRTKRRAPALRPTRPRSRAEGHPPATQAVALDPRRRPSPPANEPRGTLPGPLPPRPPEPAEPDFPFRHRAEGEPPYEVRPAAASEARPAPPLPRVPPKPTARLEGPREMSRRRGSKTLPPQALPSPPRFARRAAGEAAGGGRPRDIQALLAEILEKILRARHYPAIAREMGIQGTAVVRFRIRPDGRLDNLRIHKSSGYASLDRASLEAVRRAAPLPPLRRTLVLPIRYQLQREN